MQLTQTQMDMALKKPPRPTASKPPRPTYSADALDSLVEGMYGRRWWEEYEKPVPPDVMAAFRVVHCAFLEIQPTFDEIPLLLAIAQATRSDKLREDALCRLRLYVADCSGIDDSLKPDAQAVIDSFSDAPQ